MSQFRTAVESRMHSDRRALARFGQPATAEEITAAEAALGLPLPTSLREMYGEFDGLWFDEHGRDLPPDDDTEWWEVLPLRLLPVGQQMLLRLYGASAAYPAYGFDEPFNQCVAFFLPESGASFKFMTDLEAWGIARGRVGSWSHDGGEHDSSGTLAEWLAEIGHMRSEGQ